MKLHVVTANIIERDGKYLLIEEGHQHAYGQWNFPAGKLEEQISLEINAIKEAREESGFDVKVKRLVGVYQDMREDVNVILFAFASDIIGGHIRDHGDDEILQAKWFTLDEIKKLHLRGWYIVKAIEDHQNKEPIDSVKTLTFDKG